MNLIVLGGTGYVGQFLTAYLVENGHTVYFTYTRLSPAGVPPEIPGATAVHLDLTAESAPADLVALVVRATATAIINTAAVSDFVPCMKDEPRALAINSPAAAMRAVAAASPDLWWVHFSTDAVYTGAPGPHIEGAATSDATAYARTKVAGEEAAAAAFPTRYVVLRSALVFGPPPFLPGTTKATPIQSMAAAFSAGNAVAAFSDEYRTPVPVEYLCRVAAACAAGLVPPRVYNCGGAARMSRVEMAAAVAAAVGGDAAALIRPQPVAAATLPYPRPPDLSMECGALRAALAATGGVEGPEEFGAAAARLVGGRK